MSDMPVITTFFTVVIDGVDLGNWASLSGLGMSIESKPRLDSAVSFMHHHLPGPLSYDDIVLTRQANSFTMKTMAWFSTYHTLPTPLTASIAAVDSMGKTVLAWELMGVTPMKWAGPEFKAGGTEHGTERLTLNHMGFI